MKKVDIFVGQKVGFYDGEVLVGIIVGFSTDKPDTHIHIEIDKRKYEKSIDNLLGLL